VDAFISEIEGWIQEKLHVLPSGKTKFIPPFQRFARENTILRFRGVAREGE
jgi:hypothetical protein